jgi:hypothetical protein
MLKPKANRMYYALYRASHVFTLLGSLDLLASEHEVQGLDAKKRQSEVVDVLRHSFVDLAPKLQTHEQPAAEAVDLDWVVELHQRVVGKDGAFSVDETCS